MKLEICANSFESVLAAQQAGAHRIELCQELALGGITPSHGLLEKVMSELEIPVYVLIRPRSGDFTYTDSEVDVMLRDIAFAKTLGCQGIVSGILHRDGTINSEQTSKLIKASDGMEFTFHRAFDWTPNADEALETLINMGVQRVLNSGQKKNVVKGFETLKNLLSQAQNRIGILPGGGITAGNVCLFKDAGFTEVHASASSYRSGLKHRLSMHDISDLEKGRLRLSDADKIKGILSKF